MAATKDVIEGLQILLKYQEEKDPCGVDAQHDVIYCGPDLSALEGRITEEDKKKLDELGWHEDEEGDCWAHFT